MVVLVGFCKTVVNREGHMVQHSVVDRAHRCGTSTPDSAPHLLLWVPHQKQCCELPCPASSSESMPVGGVGVQNVGHPLHTCGPNPPYCPRSLNHIKYPSLVVKYQETSGRALLTGELQHCTRT